MDTGDCNRLRKLACVTVNCNFLYLISSVFIINVEISNNAIITCSSDLFIEVDNKANIQSIPHLQSHHINRDNIFLYFTLKSSKYLLPFTFFDQKCLGSSHVSCVCYMPRAYPLPLHTTLIIMVKVQKLTKVFIIHLSPTSHHIIPLLCTLSLNTSRLCFSLNIL